MHRDRLPMFETGRSFVNKRREWSRNFDHWTARRAFINLWKYWNIVCTDAGESILIVIMCGRDKFLFRFHVCEKLKNAQHPNETYRRTQEKRQRSLVNKRKEWNRNFDHWTARRAFINLWKYWNIVCTDAEKSILIVIIYIYMWER